LFVRYMRCSACVQCQLSTCKMYNRNALASGAALYALRHYRTADREYRDRRLCDHVCDRPERQRRRASYRARPGAGGARTLARVHARVASTRSSLYRRVTRDRRGSRKTRDRRARAACGVLSGVPCGRAVDRPTRAPRVCSLPNREPLAHRTNSPCSMLQSGRPSGFHPLLKPRRCAARARERPSAHTA
jgi:hypothetical protein